MQAALRAYRHHLARDPARIEALAQAVERFAKDMESIGLGEPERPRRYPSRVVARYALREGLSLGLGLPLAIWGLVNHGIPYQLTRLAVRLLRPDADTEATYKLMAGLVLYPACWLAEGWLAWRLLGGGPAVALVVASLLPTGFWRRRSDTGRISTASGAGPCRRASAHRGAGRPLVGRLLRGRAMGKAPTRPLGQLGEEVAARYLEGRGFEILARNLRSRLGEIDLVARDGATLVFVEVKARRGQPGDPPQAAVDARKQSRLARLALDYLAREWLRELACRFDVVAVTFEAGDPGPAGGRLPRVEHFPGAFAADGWTR